MCSLPATDKTGSMMESIHALDSRTELLSTRVELLETKVDAVAEVHVSGRLNHNSLIGNSSEESSLRDNIQRLSDLAARGFLSVEEQELLISPKITVSLNYTALTVANLESTTQALLITRKARNRRQAGNMISCKNPSASDVTRDVWISDATRNAVCPSITEIDFKATRQPMVMLHSPCACAFGRWSDEVEECEEIQYESAILKEISPDVWVVSIIPSYVKINYTEVSCKHLSS